jgi:GDP-4-dehydro-6-deoxy-D-mannose reductase
MANRALITGMYGFVGSHLEDLLVAADWEVYSFDLKYGQDLRNYEQVRKVLDKVRPTHIFHLAALAFVPESFLNPQRAVDINITGSLNILEAVRQLGLKTKIHLAGTSEEYGDAQYGHGVITEEAAPNPLSPYAISKLAMDHFGRLYAKSYGMNVVVTRAFNHTGPGRGEMYAESAFAKQIVEIENGTRKVLEHGNLESVRNYTDVRDIVKAYVQAIELESGVYNICSDQNVSMQEVLDTLISKSKSKIKTEVNPALYRPADFSFKVPNCKKFKIATHWKPDYKLDQTLTEILNYWREVLA